MAGSGGASGAGAREQGEELSDDRPSIIDHRQCRSDRSDRSGRDCRTGHALGTDRQSWTLLPASPGSNVGHLIYGKFLSLGCAFL